MARIEVVVGRERVLYLELASGHCLHESAVEGGFVKLCADVVILMFCCRDPRRGRVKNDPTFQWRGLLQLASTLSIYCHLPRSHDLMQ